MNDLSNIRTKAINGFFWSLTENGGSYLFNFIIGLILVRLIPPVDYGILGMMTIFVSVGNVLTNAGLSTALIQKINSNSKDYSTVFIIQVSLGILFYFFVFIISPFVAGFYNQPEITGYLRLFALSPLISAFGIIQSTILNKNLSYRRWARINIISLVCAGIVAVILAFYGYGLYALIALQLIQNIVSTIQLWFLGGWSYGFEFSKSSLYELSKFSKSLLFISVINTLYSEIYYSLIGKLFKATQLGYYLRAKQTVEIFSTQFTYTFNKVMFPVFSNLQGDIVSMKSAFSKVLIMTGFINFCFMAFLSANAEPFFVLLFTAKWNAAIPIFKILCVEGMVLPIHVTAGNLLLAKGKSSFFMKIELIKRIIQTLMIILTWSSVTNLVWGQLVIAIIFTIISLYISKKELNFSIWEQTLTLIPYIILAFIIYSVNFLSFEFVKSLSNIQIISLNFSISLIIYILIGYFFKLEAFTSIHEIILERLNLKVRK